MTVDARVSEEVQGRSTSLNQSHRRHFVCASVGLAGAGDRQEPC